MESPTLPDGVSSVDELLFYVDRRQSASYLTLSCSCFLLYEYIITFDQEVSIIWQPKFVWTKLLLISARYFPLLTSLVRLGVIIIPSISFPDCVRAVEFTAFMSVLVVAFLDAIQMLRIWALYGRSKKVLIFFSILTLAAVAAGLTLIAFDPPKFDWLPPATPPSLLVCRHGHPSEYFVLFLLMTGVEIIIFGMLVCKVWTESYRGPFLMILFKYGAIYFGVMFLTLFLSTVGPLIPFISVPVMDSEITINIGAVACMRLVFSLRSITAPVSPSDLSLSLTSPTHALRPIPVPIGNNNNNNSSIKDDHQKTSFPHWPYHHHAQSSMSEDISLRDLQPQSSKLGIDSGDLPVKLEEVQEIQV